MAASDAVRGRSGVRYHDRMRHGFLSIFLVGAACAPDKDSSTPAGSSEGSSGANDTTSASEGTGEAPTTGAAGACERPAGEAIDALVFKNGPIVVRPGLLTCADEAGVGACLCSESGIDRLVIEAEIAVGTQVFTVDDGPDRIQCAMGDDGCEFTTLAGTLDITRADADCVAGTIDFGAAGSGSFAAAPCG